MDTSREVGCDRELSRRSETTSPHRATSSKSTFQWGLKIRQTKKRWQVSSKLSKHDVEKKILELDAERAKVHLLKKKLEIECQLKVIELEKELAEAQLEDIEYVTEGELFKAASASV